MTHPVKVLFASGSPAAIALVLERLKTIMPELPLVIVSEFEPPDRSGGEWIRYHVKRSWRENRALIRAKLGARRIRIAAVILEPRTPHWPMRLTGFTLAPQYFLAFNEHGEHFMLRPRSVPSMLRHVAWRTGNFFRSQFKTGGWTRKQIERVRHPAKIRQPIYYRLALMRGRLARARAGSVTEVSQEHRPEGISVVIPSRNGFALLKQCLPRITSVSRSGDATEIVVVDNGSTADDTPDSTIDALRGAFPEVIVEHSPEPLSFARAINQGIAKARYSHVCVLNNDMLAESGFLRELRLAFDRVPDLFAATAQIFFPEGQRREETGKTVMPPDRGITDFPVRCDEPIVSEGGEDLSYVLYGSGGCTLYDAEKLNALGGFDEVYEPAYVEDLDLGVRAWQRGWPSVYCAGARVLHLHRATTSRYFSARELDRALEYNYLRFLARAIGDRARFQRMWRENIVRLNLLKDVDALEFAARLRPVFIEDARTDFWDLVNGDVAVFLGKQASNKPVILIASPYLPFPLAHGAAVRVYNLMRRAARDFDQVLVACVEQAGPIPQELRDICVEVVTVRRRGSHALPSTTRPDTVEEFDLPAFHAALRQTVAKWQPGIVQLEFTQMAVYARDCAPVALAGPRTILVEHDITFDLFAQMLAQAEDWETRREYDRWLDFEREAWKRVDRVVVMSERDRLAVASGKDSSAAPRSVVIANGVDLERFQPAFPLTGPMTEPMTEPGEPELSHQLEPRRLLFIGSFAHRPNVLAMQFFLREVFPLLKNVTVHVIAGRRHQAFFDLRHAGVEVEGFVSDVRPAYRLATLVIAPLVASAGTNIKIMEAMAMGKAIVSTEAGIHGLDLERGKDLVVANSAEEMAGAITRLLDHPEERRAMERHARATAERLYGWDAIAERQAELYRLLLREVSR